MKSIYYLKEKIDYNKIDYNNVDKMKKIINKEEYNKFIKDKIYNLLKKWNDKQIELDSNVEEKYTFQKQIIWFIELERKKLLPLLFYTWKLRISKKSFLSYTCRIYDYMIQWIWWGAIKDNKFYEEAFELLVKLIIYKRSVIIWDIDTTNIQTAITDFKNLKTKYENLIIKKEKKRQNKEIEEKNILENVKKENEFIRIILNNYEDTINNLENLQEQAKKPWIFWLYEMTSENTFKKQVKNDIKKEIKKYRTLEKENYIIKTRLTEIKNILEKLIEIYKK